jgi:GNAT superfamily N-acetyltransferase
MLGLIPLPLQLKECPGNLDGRVGLALVEARLDQGKSPIEGESGCTGMRGEPALLPWRGVQGKPVGLHHRGHAGAFPRLSCRSIRSILEAGPDSRWRSSTVRTRQAVESARLLLMKSLVVRRAQPSDAEDLARNWIHAAQHYAELDADAFQVPPTGGLVAWFEGLLQRPRSEDAVWLVAEVDGRVVGDVAARLERPTEDAGRQLLRDLGRVRLYVDALAVEETYRRRGVGARLMHAVEEWGRLRGAVRSVLTTYHTSPLSVPFYEQGMGYERRSIIFEKRLD